jgi:hypothetical protein
MKSVTFCDYQFGSLLLSMFKGLANATHLNDRKTHLLLSWPLESMDPWTEEASLIPWINTMDTCINESMNPWYQ